MNSWGQRSNLDQTLWVISASGAHSTTCKDSSSHSHWHTHLMASISICYWITHARLAQATRWIDPYWSATTQAVGPIQPLRDSLLLRLPSKLTIPNHQQTQVQYSMRTHTHDNATHSTPSSSEWPHEVGWSSSHIWWWKWSKISPRWSVDSTQRSTRRCS